MPEDSNQSSSQQQATTDPTATDTTQQTALGGDQAAADTTATDTTTTTDDLAALFSPEEVKAKKETIEANKVEEERRGKLTEEERTAEDANKAEEAKAHEVPEEYAPFKIPDGMEMDTELLKEIMPLFKEKKLTQADAQEFITAYAEKVYPAVVKKQLEAWQTQTEAWKKEVQANKEIKLDGNGENADGIRVINTLLTADEAKRFKDDLNRLGMGNHPLLNLMYARMATALKEDTFEAGARKGEAQQDVAHRLYPDLK